MPKDTSINVHWDFLQRMNGGNDHFAAILSFKRDWA